MPNPTVKLTDIDALRDALRSATLGAEHTFQKEIVEYNGMRFELRQPTVGQRSAIMRRAAAAFITKSKEGKDIKDDDDSGVEVGGFKVDFGAMQLWAVIYCTYIPGTNTNVFTEEDYDALANLPTGTFLDNFGQKIMAMLNAPAKDISPKSSDDNQNASA